MATTEDRLQEVKDLEELFHDSPGVDVPKRASRDDWCRGLLIGWLAVFGSIVVFEPAPTNPEAAIPAWGNLLLTAFTLALFASVIGLSLRRSWGLRTSLVAGSLGMVVGVACVVTDHHMGIWGAYEIVAFSGLAAASFFGTKASVDA